MKPKNVIGIILILAASALFGCGRGGGDEAPPQPVRANVFIAIDQSVSDLAGLDFVLNNAPGATFDNNAPQITVINAAEGQSLVVGNFDAATNTNHILLANGSAVGIRTGTTPIIRVTYDVAAGSGSPTFSIASQTAFLAIAPNEGPTTPPVSAANMVVTVTYEYE